MTTTDPWADPPPADPNIRIGPSVYAADPPAVVTFLHPDYPWHLTHDAGAYTDDDDDEAGDDE